jgi:CRP-like cAMP-binding protein
LFFVEGRAKVYSKMENGTTLLLRFYRPFDILGDVELFAYDSYIFDVVAITETACLGVPVALIRKLADRNTALLMKICARLGSKMADFNVSAAINLRYPVENRLASYLLATTEAETGRSAAPTAKTARSTDDLGELADILGASYRQLARVVGRFRDEGILEKRRGRIAVADRAKLEPLARDCYL